MKLRPEEDLQPPNDINAVDPIAQIERAYDVLYAEMAATEYLRIGESFVEAIRALYSCSYPILTTGMGKAGHIARKFAATLCSTGSPAVYLHPGEAAHGDLGIIGPGITANPANPRKDVLVAFSTSGKTEEVLETIRRGRNLGLDTVIGVTSHPDSELRKVSDIVIDMGTIDEAGELGLAPSASIAAMLAISDALAIVLSEEMEFSAKDFGDRHHGGYLGKKARRR